MHIEEGIETVPEKEKKAWHLHNHGGLNEVFYSPKGHPVFSLVYGSFPQELTIRLSTPVSNYARIGIQHGIMLSLYQKCVGLHGVTLLCGDEIVILSAPSGTGKTTLAKLLEKYCNAIIINGDFALLSPTADAVVFEPTPFCGTSGRALNHRFMVNRVIFLGQAKENNWRTLDGREAMIKFMSNAFVPEWDNFMQQAVQGNILSCVSMLKVNAYDFAPTKEAAEMFMKQLAENSQHRSE
ncbi:MAG: ATP-binding protein [Clostridia bacterium]|nr:ATP-binding protein [Clostridia bacterium]